MAENKPIFNDRDSRLIKKWILGGVGLGGSAALLTSLINHIKGIKEAEDDQDPERMNDDTLYINLRKRNEKSASVAGSVALAGGALSALGSYALVHYLYQKAKKKHLQQQLDEAQNAYIDLVSQNKEAAASADGERMKLPETALSFPGALAIILGLGGGVVTNHLLNKAFPVKKSPARRNPRRVVIRSISKVDDTTSASGSQEEKEAVINKEARVSPDGHEGTEFLVNLLMHTKRASLRPFQDLIAAVAQGRHDEMASGLYEYGLDTVHDMVKGASLTPVSEEEKVYAVGAAVRSPVLGPTVALMAAAEFNDTFPHHCKWASALSEREKENLQDVVGIFNIGNRIDSTYEHFQGLLKSAEFVPPGLESLQNILGLGSVIPKPSRDEDSDEDSDEGSSETTEKNKSPVTVVNDDGALQFKEENQDIIDSVLS